MAEDDEQRVFPVELFLVRRWMADQGRSPDTGDVVEEMTFRSAVPPVVDGLRIMDVLAYRRRTATDDADSATVITQILRPPLAGRRRRRTGRGEPPFSTHRLTRRLGDQSWVLSEARPFPTFAAAASAAATSAVRDVRARDHRPILELQP